MNDKSFWLGIKFLSLSLPSPHRMIQSTFVCQTQYTDLTKVWHKMRGKISCQKQPWHTDLWKISKNALEPSLPLQLCPTTTLKFKYRILANTPGVGRKLKKKWNCGKTMAKLLLYLPCKKRQHSSWCYSTFVHGSLLTLSNLWCSTIWK